MWDTLLCDLYDYILKTQHAATEYHAIPNWVVLKLFRERQLFT